MNSTTTTVATASDTALVAALRKLRGRATIGDVVSATGLPPFETEAALKRLLETRRGHLEVSDSGELLYSFDPKLLARDSQDAAARFRKAAWSAFKAAFKVWTAVMLVAYFVLFVIIIIAMLTAARDRNGGGRRGGFDLGDMFFLHLLMGGRGWNRGSLYYGHRHTRRLPKEAQPPFYKKVFAFIFGPEEAKPTRLQKDRSVLQLIRARKGLLTAAELVEHTGLPLLEAQEEMGRLMGAYEGDPHVSDTGEVVYAFPGLLKSAHGRVRAREPKPAWLRLEYPKLLTGNNKKSNAIIGTMNGFNLLAGTVFGIAPAVEVAVSGAGAVDPLFFWGLGIVPVVYSACFFAIPLLRSPGLAHENEKRRQRNARRVLLEIVYQSSVGSVRWISADEAIRNARRRLGLERTDAADAMLKRALEELAAEFDAEVKKEDSGFYYSFPAIRITFAEAELMRRQMKLQDQKLGEIVYSTADTAAEASKRDLKAFDRELARSGINLSRYVPAPGQTGYEEDFEVALKS